MSGKQFGNVINQNNSFLVSAQELAANLSRYKIIDASWYLPAQKRNGRTEFDKSRIPNAVYFDIDNISDKSSHLPHMLPTQEYFASAVGALGINENDDIVVYDGPGLFSAARCWWSLRTMGATSVRILQGGYDRWKNADYPIDTKPPIPPTSTKFTPKFDATKVSGFDTMLLKVKDKNSVILDARPYARWLGEAKEPRAGLRSGHMPGSFSLPASDLVVDGNLLDIEQLKSIFSNLKVTPDMHVTTSCGSGVTAAIISLALESIGHENHTLYDGSWAEWGAQEYAPVIEWKS